MVEEKPASVYADDLFIASRSSHNTVQRLEQDSLAYLTVKEFLARCKGSPSPASLPTSIVSIPSLSCTAELLGAAEHGVKSKSTLSHMCH